MQWSTPQLLLLATIACVLYFALTRRRSPPYPLPPGPKPHLILGNLRDLSTEELWIKAHTWAKLYGPYPPRPPSLYHRSLLISPFTGRITYLRVFSQSLVFLNTPKAVFDLLDRRGSIYSDRLHLVMAKELYALSVVLPNLTWLMSSLDADAILWLHLPLTMKLSAASDASFKWLWAPQAFRLFTHVSSSRCDRSCAAY